MGSRSRYIPGLDGLRALAVIAVVLYHMNFALLPCGLLGVTLFFVLSGYLITGLLIREWHETKNISLPRFWMHRVRRLFPAILLVVMVSIVLTGIFAPDMLTKLRRDLAAALFWFTNWWYIFLDVSYFEAFAAPSPVTHFWSLAIEEQFYLIWPPILLLLFRSKVRKKSIQVGILVAAAASVLLMVILYDPAGDPSRVYYGTDTRAFSLLLGAWLAFVFPEHRVRGKGRKGLTDAQRKLVGNLGIVGLVGIIACMVFVDTYAPFLYYGGILLVSIFTALLILALVDPTSVMAKVFSFAPLVYIGQISYGIYLWHYPIILLLTDFNAVTATPWYVSVLQIVLVLVAASLSYRFVEQPIRRGCLGRMYAAVQHHETNWKDVLKTHVVQVALAMALLIGSVIVCIVVPETTTQHNTDLTEAAVVPEGAFENDTDANDTPVVAGELQMEGFNGDSSMTRDEMLAVLGSNPSLVSLSDQTLMQLVNTPGTTARDKACNTRFLMIGDSVTVALADGEGYGGFSETFPNAILDSAQSRPASKGPQVFKYYQDKGWDGPVVIYELGTNMKMTSSEAEAMIAAVPAGKMIFLVNIRTPGDNQDSGNAVLQTAAANHDNVQIIDWYSESANRNDYFDGDGTHLTPSAGHDAYLNMLVRALSTLYQTR